MINSRPEDILKESLLGPSISKDNLLDCLFDAIVESGSKVISLAAPSHFPFLLQIRSKASKYRVRAYLWPFIKKVPYQNEFQIQVNNIDHFALVPGEKTLVLGWWKEAKVFAGFDVRRHLGKLRLSYSLEIPENVLRKAYVNSFYPYYKSNKEAVIAFTSDFFIDYVNNLEPLHDFSESAQDMTILSDITQAAKINDAHFKIQDAERRKTFLSLSKKIRDMSFQKRVLNVYSYRCAFCGSFESVEAAHIIPVNHEKSTDETRNGLALCALHHKAYDQALIAIVEDYSVVLNRSQTEELKKLRLDSGLAKFAKDLRPIVLLPPAINDRPHIEYIKIANNIRGWK